MKERGRVAPDEHVKPALQLSRQPQARIWPHHCLNAGHGHIDVTPVFYRARPDAPAARRFPETIF